MKPSELMKRIEEECEELEWPILIEVDFEVEPDGPDIHWDLWVGER